MAKPNGVIYSTAKSPQHPKLYAITQGANHCKQGTGHLSVLKLKFSTKGFWPLGGKVNTVMGSRGSYLVCQSTDTHNTETKERVRHYGDCSNISSSQSGDEHPIETAKNISSSQGLAEACRFVSNDAKFVNERARNDIVLLSRGIMKLDARARQDVAFLGSEFLKLDARAREDTEKVDHDVKRKAEKLHHVATILKNIAQSSLKSAADKHWSDGALEVSDDALGLPWIYWLLVIILYVFPLSASGRCSFADLKRADFAAKRRAMEDSLMALEEAYWSIASALSEADGIDYTDPEELELLVAALIDLDAMDGKSSVSLLAECSSSPDVSTRRALANALSAAPSMWTLGNAGMGALQRLAEDSNPAIAAAASKTIYELKKQWEIEEGDSWRFMMNQTLMSEVDDDDEEDGTETD
ncbi:hypothetical protein DH2020_040380 [Rehmannia glutinosa]|uniref:Uncharacterized protein n=1 Tax=Rehmannia glutinosa TaxID=99300 RepID=A0ABR0UTW1_REHGL